MLAWLATMTGWHIDDMLERYSFSQLTEMCNEMIIYNVEIRHGRKDAKDKKWTELTEKEREEELEEYHKLYGKIN